MSTSVVVVSSTTTSVVVVTSIVTVVEIDLKVDVTVAVVTEVMGGTGYLEEQNDWAG